MAIDAILKRLLNYLNTSNEENLKIEVKKENNLIYEKYKTKPTKKQGENEDAEKRFWRLSGICAENSDSRRRRNEKNSAKNARRCMRIRFRMP